MLADPDALCKALGKKTEARTLGIPTKAKLVDPRASKKQRQEYKGNLYKKLGLEISLNRLSEVPSYQQFVEDLTATLRTLNLIQNYIG